MAIPYHSIISPDPLHHSFSIFVPPPSLPIIFSRLLPLPQSLPLSLFRAHNSFPQAVVSRLQGSLDLLAPTWIRQWTLIQLFSDFPFHKCKYPDGETCFYSRIHWFHQLLQQPASLGSILLQLHARSGRTNGPLWVAFLFDDFIFIRLSMPKIC